MQAGQLNNRIELQRATESQDAYGAATATWATYAKPWAEIKQPSARQLDQGRSFSDTITHVVRMRHRTDILPSDRIKWGTRYLYIDGITDPDGGRVETLIYATERVD
jgi:SPP1 family predicted phage head-tail adaptor